MAWYVALWTGIVAVILFLWILFKEWILIFIAPVKNLEMLWIIVPIYINGIFTEIFQEKKGTGLGNAVTNGAVLLWVSIDWIRYMTRNISEGTMAPGWSMILKFSICTMVLTLGFFIIFEGIKGRKFISFMSRVRGTTYLTLMVSPIVYDIIKPTWLVLLAIVIYFPLFYHLIELADRYTPNPITYESKEDDEISDEDFKI